MSKEKIYIFDTTLRDGAQGQSIFSLKAPKEPYTAAYKLL